MNKRYILGILAPAFVLLFLKTARSESLFSDITYSVSAGPSYIHGDYDDYFSEGLTGKFNAFYNYPVFGCNTYFRTGLSLNHYTMSSSSESELVQFDLLAGAGFYFTFLKYIEFIAGMNINGVYSNLTTDNTGRDEKAFKPGYSFSAGAMTLLGRGVGLSLLADYRQITISDRPFNNIDLTFGITYNYGAYRKEIELASISEKKLIIYNQGVSEFKKKSFEDAKKSFFKLREIDSKFPGLDYYIKRIEEIEQDYEAAETLIRQQNYIKAIAYLEACAPYKKECETKLITQRNALKARIPEWEAEAIKNYEEKKYVECIELMEKILKVDPDNRNANIYLPRAIKRQKAIEALQGN